MFINFGFDMWLIFRLILFDFRFVSNIVLFMVVICNEVDFCCWWNCLIVVGSIFSVVVGSVLICIILVLVFFLWFSVCLVVFNVFNIFIVWVKNCLSGIVNCVFSCLCLNRWVLVSCFSLFSVLESVGWFRLRVLVVCFRVFCCVMVINVWRWCNWMCWLNRLFFFISDVKNKVVWVISKVVCFW